MIYNTVRAYSKMRTKCMINCALLALGQEQYVSFFHTLVVPVSVFRTKIVVNMDRYIFTSLSVCSKVTSKLVQQVTSIK